MQKRHKDYKTYFEESATSSAKYYLPYIYERMSLSPQKPIKVLEVGCGLGGNLAPFARMGCKVSGVDIDAEAIERAKNLFAEKRLKADFTCADIHTYADNEKYDLILLHDAIEHIPNKKGLMLRLSSLLADEGVLYIAFPAWHMPFGGHQQVGRTKIVSHCPFIHLLPGRFYAWLLRKLGEPEGAIRDFLNIKATRVTIQTFQRLCTDTSYKIVHRQLYLINPHYETKFGLRPRVLWRGVASIPYLRDFFSTSCHYLVVAQRGW